MPTCCLTEKSALKVSPAFMPPATDAPFYTAVGIDENEGFHLQNALIAQRWKKTLRGNIPCPGDNHFSVLDQLSRPGGKIFQVIEQAIAA